MVFLIRIVSDECINVVFSLMDSLVWKEFSNLIFIVALPLRLVQMIIIYKANEIKGRRNTTIFLYWFV